ncbi:MAG: sulfite exporter TauE/SafE family protein [Jiangellaceae bacterium]
MIVAATVAAAVLIGVTLGLLGGGGTILTVPILVYIAGVPAKEAIAMSLFVVAVTAAFALLPHARADRVRWRTGAAFGLAGMAGAYAGGRVAEFIPGTLLLVGFGLMMLATAVAMLRGRRTPAEGPRPAELPVVSVLVHGLVVGLVTGLVGAGGGFLIVPALVLLGGMPMAAAVGTSLFVIAMKSGAGLLGYLHSVNIDWALAGAVTAAAVGGSFLGALLVGKIGQDALRRGFAAFVVGAAVFMLAQQVPAAVWTWLAGSSAGWGVLTATAIVLIVAAAFGWRRWRDSNTTHGAGLHNQQNPIHYAR